MLTLSVEPNERVSESRLLVLPQQVMPGGELRIEEKQRTEHLDSICRFRNSVPDEYSIASRKRLTLHKLANDSNTSYAQSAFTS